MAATGRGKPSLNSADDVIMSRGLQRAAVLLCWSKVSVYLTVQMFFAAKQEEFDGERGAHSLLGYLPDALHAVIPPG